MLGLLPPEDRILNGTYASSASLHNLLADNYVLGGVDVVRIELRGAEDAERREAQSLQAKYADDLKQLAAWCEEKGLMAEARQTLAVLGPHDPMKFYLPILPDDVAPAKLPEGASKDAEEWNAKLGKLRREQSAALYDLAKRIVRTRHAGLAMDLVLDAIRANPDNESLRRMLGYQKFQNQWHTIYEVKKYHAGMVWNDKFGWLPKSHVRRYEDGQRFFEGKWISAAEDAQRHADINSGWVVETEHYSIRTNHSIEAAVGLGLKLEDLYHLWEQMFIRYFASDADILELFDGRAKIQHAVPMQFKVVCFRDHNEYVNGLSADAEGRHLGGCVSGFGPDRVFLRRQRQRRPDDISRSHAPIVPRIAQGFAQRGAEGQFLDRGRHCHVHGIAQEGERLLRAGRFRRPAHGRRPIPVAPRPLLRATGTTDRLRHGKAAKR